MFPYTFPGLALSNLFYFVNCAIFVPCSSTLIILEVLFSTLFALELKFDSAGGRYEIPNHQGNTTDDYFPS